MLRILLYSRNVRFVSKIKCVTWQMGQGCYRDIEPEDFYFMKASDIEQDSRGSSGNSTTNDCAEEEREILTPKDAKFLRQVSQARELVNKC